MIDDRERPDRPPVEGPDHLPPPTEPDSDVRSPGGLGERIGVGRPGPLDRDKPDLLPGLDVPSDPPRM